MWWTGILTNLQERKSQTSSQPKLFGNVGFVKVLCSCLPAITLVTMKKMCRIRQSRGRKQEKKKETKDKQERDDGEG